MHILFISAMEGSPWGGSEELWSQAALHILEKGHSVSASVCHWPTLSPKITALKDAGVAVHVRAPNRGRIVDRLRWRLLGDFEQKWLLRSRPDVVVISQGCQTDGLGWMLFCRENRIPFVTIVQCNAEMWWPTDEVSGQMALAYRAAKEVICVSRHNLELLQQQIGGELSQGRVVCNPYQIPHFSHLWPASQPTWKMACVARLDPAAKGQDLLLQVLAQPPWRERALDVEFYGTGPCEKGLHRMAIELELDKVHFHGHTTDVAGIWERNHLLVLPSRFEGTPLALIEAMWCERAAIVTNVGGSAEWCREETTGFVASAPTVELLSAAMERAWLRREEWQDLGRAAYRSCREKLPEDPAGQFGQEILNATCG